MTDQIESPDKIGVFLVEDSPTQVVLMQAVLAANPHLNLVAVAKDGDDALAYLRRTGKHAQAQRPDLVLLDINLPTISGIEVLEQMKADEGLKDIPVVMLTASTDDQDMAQSYAGGAATFISKPPKPADLEEVLCKLGSQWSDLRVPKSD